MEEKRRVLITGASGTVGTILREAFRDRYRLRLMQHTTPMEGEEDVVTGDVCDFEAVLRAAEGMDTIVHLAGVAGNRGWTQLAFDQALLQININGTYNVFEAARRQGVRRIVFASTNRAVSGYDGRTHVTTDMPVRPHGMYGISKYFGEVMGRHYADAHRLSVVCLRIAALLPEDHPRHRREETWSVWLSHRDLAQLVGLSVDAQNIHFEVFHGISGNTRRWCDISNAQRILGYRPQDDAEKYARKYGQEVRKYGGER